MLDLATKNNIPEPIYKSLSYQDPFKKTLYLANVKFANRSIPSVGTFGSPDVAEENAAMLAFNEFKDGMSFVRLEM